MIFPEDKKIVIVSYSPPPPKKQTNKKPKNPQKQQQQQTHQTKTSQAINQIALSSLIFWKVTDQITDVGRNASQAPFDDTSVNANSPPMVERAPLNSCSDLCTQGRTAQ